MLFSIGKGTAGTISIGRGGSIGGFRSHILTCLEEELSIVILTNFSNGSPAQMVNMIAGIVIESEDNQEFISQEPVRTLKLSNKVLSKYEGSYWNIKSNYSRKIYLRDDTLRYFRSENSENALIPTGKDEFKMFGVSGNIIIKFDMSEREPMMNFLVDGIAPILHKAYSPIDADKLELAAYAGRFYSPELETAYIISFVDDTLICHHSRHGDFEMQRIKKDILQSEWPVSITKFQRDEEGEITGILVSNERAINVWFEKQ